MKALPQILIILASISQSCLGSAYYAGKREMILRADAIVIAQVTGVAPSEKKGRHFTYREKASANVERCLKGDAKGTIDIYGNESFICAQCRYSAGRFLLFLDKAEGFWTGYNWHLGIRPIQAGMVEWFKDGERVFQIQEALFDDVISEVVAVVDEQRHLAKNTVWSRISPEGTGLQIPRDASINDDDYKELAAYGAFRRLRSLHIDTRSLTESTLRHFYDAPIEYLNLSQSKVSDEALGELLGHLPRLRRVNLASTPLSDAGLSRLVAEGLEELVIYNTAISDAGLSNIDRFKKLKHLNLPGKNLTNLGYRHLARATSLEELYIAYAGVTDDTIGYIKDLPIKKLGIFEARITGAATQTIGEMRSLVNLRIGDCHIGDQGVKYLRGLSQLEEVHLDECAKFHAYQCPIQMHRVRGGWSR